MRASIIALSTVFVLGMAVVPAAAAETSQEADLPPAYCTLDNPPSHCQVGPLHCSFSDGWTSPVCWVDWPSLTLGACTLDNPPSHCYVGPVNCSFSDGWTSPECWID